MWKRKCTRTEAWRPPHTARRRWAGEGGGPEMAAARLGGEPETTKKNQ